MSEQAEPVAHPSEYFKQKEVTAKGNEASVLVKGKYSPEIIHVKAGLPVTLHFYRDEDADCTNEVVFEGLNIRKRLPARETTTIVLMPSDTGEIPFSCGMGMVRGKLIVEK
jgi:plastocyanin domain-containing protein